MKIKILVKVNCRLTAETLPDELQGNKNYYSSTIKKCLKISSFCP